LFHSFHHLFSAIKTLLKTDAAFFAAARRLILARRFNVGEYCHDIPRRVATVERGHRYKSFKRRYATPISFACLPQP
jgi:hypothetical protein